MQICFAEQTPHSCVGRYQYGPYFPSPPPSSKRNEHMRWIAIRTKYWAYRTELMLWAVKSAHKRLVAKWHPDINSSSEATEKLQQINQAREELLAKAQEDNLGSFDLATEISNLMNESRRKEWQFFHSDALDNAICEDDIAAIQECIDKGMDPAFDAEGHSRLYKAVSKGSAAAVELLLKHKVQDRSWGRSENLLSTASLRAKKEPSKRLEYIQIIKALLQAGVPINEIDNNSGRSVLELAVHDGDIEIVRLLLIAGADAQMSKDRSLPLHEACIQGDVAMIQLLLDFHADVNGRPENPYTPLHVASYNGCVEAVKLLLAKGANVLAVQKECTDASPLIAACSIPQTGTYSILGGRTFICRDGSETEKLAIVCLLLQAGADVNIENRFGDRALNYAILWRYHQIADVLIQHGAQLGSKESGCLDRKTRLRVKMMQLQAKFLHPNFHGIKF